MDTSPRQRLLALGLLFAILGALYGLLVVPYLDLLDHYGRQVRQLESRLAVYAQTLSDGAVAENQLRELARYETAQRLYLPSEKSALSSAALQRHVKEAIERSGGTVVSSQVLREKNEGNPPEVVLRISMRLGTDAFEKVLYSLEYDRPLLFLDNVYIASRPTISTLRMQNKQPRQLLDVRFEVTGYRRQGTDG